MSIEVIIKAVSVSEITLGERWVGRQEGQGPSLRKICIRQEKKERRVGEGTEVREVR